MRSRSVVTTSSCISRTRDEVRPLRGVRVDALEAAHGEQVRGVDLEHLAVHLPGLLDLAERRLVEAAGAQLGGRRSARAR